MALTKFYLHGGNSSDNSPESIEFRKSLIADLAVDANVLFCYFGKEKARWNELIERDRKNFNSLNSKLSVKMATEEEFVEQTDTADLLVFPGGDTFILIDKLKQYPNFADLLINKVVVASSAGACALSNYFYSNDEQRVGEGLGVLNLKVFCHYNPEKDKNILKLNEYKENLEIVALPERHWVVLFR